ncbi:hypothetical protein [Actinoplanes sp. N902-109]|uniref:hypothetical protein n=1 Tax=Actinoplanes sp. (strain N902-109) TaxID=649831 RepID=UPI00039A7C6C|nr:hypothetical protein [Actinoplanes sp. N902-109]
MKPLAALTLLPLLAAGCANTGAGGEPADGRPALAASLSGLTAGNYTFTRSDGTAGAVHLPDSSSISRQYGPSVLRTGSAFYLRYKIHGEAYDAWRQLIEKHAAGADPQELRTARQVMDSLDGKHWVRADEKRLHQAADAEDQSGMENLPAAPDAAAPDVTGAAGLAGAVVSAQLDGRTITGTLDATQVDPQLGLFTNDPFYFYGPRAKQLPFRATIDDKGRLSTITVTLPGALQAPASADPVPSDAPTEAAEPPVTITVSHYGDTPPQTAPAGARELDPAAYEMLTNDVD